MSMPKKDVISFSFQLYECPGSENYKCMTLIEEIIYFRFFF